jgi:hypothetical protein
MENITYEVIEKTEDPGESKILKSGLTAEFTLNDITRDVQYLQKKKEELESQIGVEAARMTNIDGTNPEIGQMDERMRQVIYLYERAFAFCKVGKEKVAEIDAQMKSYREELMQIVMQTGLAITKPENEPGEQGTN